VREKELKKKLSMSRSWEGTLVWQQEKQGIEREYWEGEKRLAKEGDELLGRDLALRK